MDLQGKKVLVTGADGFIGSHLVEALVKQGAQVKALVHYNALGHWGWMEDVDKALLLSTEILLGDIRDPHAMNKMVQGMDIVFHLAALIGIPYSYHSPDSYVDTNVVGTLNILQACREHAIERLLITSTSEIYGTAQYTPIDEKHIRQAQSPYSASKIGADALAQSFHLSYELPLVIVRPFNTYGPRQSARAIIPSIISQLLMGKTEIKLGSLHPSRDLLFVSDTVAAFLAIAKTPALLGRDVNIASATEISMQELAIKIIEKINPSALITSDLSRTRPGSSEVDRLVGDYTLLHQYTGWKPQVSLENGLEHTIAWFREPAHLQRYKADVYTL